MIGSPQPSGDKQIWPIQIGTQTVAQVIVPTGMEKLDIDFLQYQFGLLITELRRTAAAAAKEDS